MPNSENQAQNHPILFFDGVCNLCNGTVQWIIRHDPEGIIHFVPLQSDFAKKILAQLGWKGDSLSSVLFLDDGKVYVRSEAVRQVLRRIMPRSPLLLLFYISPRFLKDGIYTLIARNRYEAFGKRETCMVPGPGILDRFIESSSNL